MRFLADENVPYDAITSLQARGHDVVWIRREAPGIYDDKALARAMSEERILITFDKDFGELAFRRKLPASCGIILFRIPVPSPKYVAQMVVTAVESRDDWAGHFSVVEENRIRIRPLPSEDK